MRSRTRRGKIIPERDSSGAYNSAVPELSFKLRIGEDELSAKVFLPAEPIRPVELLPILNKLTDAFTGIATSRAEGSGETVSCRAGCGACCRQVVPISETEAFRLAGVIKAMPAGQKQKIIARFEHIVEVLQKTGLLSRLISNKMQEEEEQVLVGIEYFRLGLPCPFLEEESCSIHPDRPSSCREYLVTSPAETCSAANAENIRPVTQAAKLSRLLFRFGDGRGKEQPRWLPLILLLDWTSTHSPEMQGSVPGTEMFQNFMALLTSDNNSGR